MKTYLVRFTPQEPYFFGNEKNFLFPGQSATQTGNAYFIRSELTPSQTTLFGALRYALLPVKKQNWAAYTEDDRKQNAAAVGEESFSYGKKQTDFGMIKSMSPVLLFDDQSRPLVVTPFDHIKGNETYTPLQEYRSIVTPDDEKMYAADYNAKEGIDESYMRLCDGTIIKNDTLFLKEARIGVNRTASQNGFFKKEYIRLVTDYSFGVYLTLDDAVLPKNTTAFLGQGKSLFLITFEECADNNVWKTVETSLKTKLRENMHYCFSDAFVSNEIYAKALFAASRIRDYRAFTTDNQNGKISKASVLHKLIGAGSVFMAQDNNLLTLFDDPYAKIVGFNHII